MIFIDTNVFVVALRYPRDQRATDNAAFLDAVRQRDDAATSLVNVLETCGILSFNLNRRQLLGLYTHFGRRFNLRIVPESDVHTFLGVAGHEVLGFVARRMSFGDALIALAIERHAPETDVFVSWDARHFRGKVSASVMTPTEFLA